MQMMPFRVMSEERVSGLRGALLAGFLCALPSVSEPSEPVDTNLITDQSAKVPTPATQQSSPTAEGVIEKRILNYPSGYMRREPVVHRSTDNAFVTGRSLELTDQSVFREKAEMQHLYHVTQPEMPTLKATGGDMKKPPGRNTMHNDTAAVAADGKKADTPRRSIFRPISH